MVQTALQGAKTDRELMRLTKLVWSSETSIIITLP